MVDYDWSKFRKRITIRATTQEIYNAWATQSGLERWFLRTAEFTMPNKGVRSRNDGVQKGDRYRWLWFGYGDEVVEGGTILEANEKDFLKFTFSGNCTVSVRVKEEKGETVCELSQEQIPTDEASKVSYHLGCMKGWTFYMTNLKSILEGGIDLRNKNDKITDLINA